MNSQLNMEHVDGLLPCPWCGKVPDANDPRTFWVDDSVGGKWGAVQCCGIGPDVRTGYGPVEEWRDDASAAWNTRAAGGEARGVELEQQLSAARREVVEAKVGTWQPIEDDVSIESKGWRIVVGYVGSNDDALFIEEHCQDGIYTHAVFELRANIRLCELVDVPDAGGVPLVALTPELVSALKFFVGYSEHINDTNGGISPDSPWGIAYHALRKAIAGIDAAEGQAQDGS